MFARRVHSLRPGPLRGLCSSTAKPSTVVPEDTTHFGFKEVGKQEKEGLVGEVFSRVASKYDIMNDVMSGGMHRVWKEWFISALGPQPPMRILDVAAGTGDISSRIISASIASQALRASNPSPDAPKLSVTVTDINADMLSIAKQRLKSREKVVDLRFETVNAEKLPFPDNSFDAYTIAFGIRNVTDIPAALREAHRVLVPGGRLLCLEFSNVNEVVRPAYDLYSFQIIPVMGHVIANDWDSYQYLVESIRRFPSCEDFSQMIRDAGFDEVTGDQWTMGVVAMHSGFKAPGF